MDFLSFIQDQRSKLNSCEYIDYLWNELEENQQDDEISPNLISDFNNHLPLLLEDFWKTAFTQLDTADFDELDHDLRKYLLVLIYQCLTQAPEAISLNCFIYASELYLQLLVTPQRDDFFKSQLYRTVLVTLQSTLEVPNTETSSTQLIIKWKRFLNTARLKTTDFEITLATLLHIIFDKTRKIYNNFDLEAELLSISHGCLMCLKVLLNNETVSSRKFTITTYLFNGLRKYDSNIVTAQAFTMIQYNFRNLLKDLHRKFKEDEYKTFMNAFIHIWIHPNFIYYAEAVLIMNNLKERHYRLLIDVLNKMLMSKECHKNLLKLSIAIVYNPTSHSAQEKVKVTNEILLKNILISCLSNKGEIANTAIESFAEILLSASLQKDYVMDPMIMILNCPPGQALLSTPTILRGLRSLMNKKWTNRPRNKHLFAISVSIMKLCDKNYPTLYQEILQTLTEEASPYDLKPFLQLLSQTYSKMCQKNYMDSAMHIFRVIFKMASHPMASSSDFVKYLYNAMVFPKGAGFDRTLFVDPMVTEEFNFKEFFQKCNTLGLVKKEHVGQLLGNLYTVEESNLKLVCAIVQLTDYKELSIIADYVNDNFRTVCNSPRLTYLLYIYSKIAKNCISPTHSVIKSNEIMVCFVKEHLSNQTFRWNCVANAFAILKSSQIYTNLPEDFAKLKRNYDVSLSAALGNRSSFLPFFYYSQLVVFGKMVPNDGIITSLREFLHLCSNERHCRSPEFNPKIWIGSLLLYTNICIIRTNLVEEGLNYLQKAFNSSVTLVKLAALNMMFDLCNMITHNFEDLIGYLFKELVSGDCVFKRTCLMKIDGLIRDDYLKLDLVQFIVFVAILGDRDPMLSDYCKQLLTENFLISNTVLISRNFIPLIVHLNRFTKHSIYQMSKNDCTIVEAALRNVSDRRKIFALLLHNLPIKARFNIIHNLSLNILEPMMKGKVKFGDGYWEMIQDSIHIFKLMTINSNSEDSCEEYYKKINSKICKYLSQKSELNSERLYPEHQKELMQGTNTLLKLLFFNESDSIQKHIRISVFDALIHWTDFLLADLVHLIHAERCKEIQSYYSKLDNFFQKHGATLRYTEESFNFEKFNNSDILPSTSTSFNDSNYIPDFDA